MSTETSMLKSKTLFKHENHTGVILSLTASGSALVPGQEVYISADLSVSKRTGAQFPAGVVTVGGADGKYVSVYTPFSRTIQAHSKGGTINFGTFVKPNGTVNADGMPEYVAAVAGDYASALVIDGGNVDTEIMIGILTAPFQINP